MLDPKWTGTENDRREMQTLGLEQVLRRNFGKLAMFGFASTLLCTWEAIVISLSVALSNGGTAGLFWNYIVASIGLGFVYASIAELSSMMPTAGGQYYWVALMAPRWCRRYLSYITGWLCVITWQAGLGAGGYIGGTIIQALFVLNLPNYVYERWQGTLLFLGFLLIAVFFNTVLVRRLPMVEGIFVFLHVFGVVLFIPILILAPRRTGTGPLTEFFNPNGWMSNGVATFVGATSPVASLIGFDCSVHMAEETKDSSFTVPITLLVGYVVNVLLGFFVIMTCIYTLGPLDEVLASVTGYPIIDLFYSSTNSLAAVDVMSTILLINFTAGTIAILASASRQLWSFARNGGVPFSRYLAPGHLTYDIPLNSVLSSLIIAIVLALINIGSTEVLNIIFSMYDSALISSYIITISCLLLHRLRGRRLPQSRYSLGKWGTLVNILALIYLAPILIFSFFPPTPNPTPAVMNWSCVMVGGVVVLATIYYIIWGRKTYTPPKGTVEDFLEAIANHDDVGILEGNAGRVEHMKIVEAGKDM